MQSIITGNSASPHGPETFLSGSKSWCLLPCPGDLLFIPPGAPLPEQTSLVSNPEAWAPEETR